MSALVQILDIAAFVTVCLRLAAAADPEAVLKRLFDFYAATVRKEPLWGIAFFLLLVTMPGLFVFVGVGLAERRAAREKEDSDAE